MPEPASVASTLTVTSPCRFEPSVGEVIAAVGATASSLIAWVRTSSALPARSQVRNLTVVASVSVNGAVYSGELGVGSVPSSV